MKNQTLPARPRLPQNLTFHVYISSPYLLLDTPMSLNGAVTLVKSFLVIFKLFFPPAFEPLLFIFIHSVVYYLLTDI